MFINLDKLIRFWYFFLYFYIILKFKKNNYIIICLIKKMNHYLTVINNLLTENECDYFINLIDNCKNTKNIDRGNYANYNKLDWINSVFANILYKRICNYLPNDNNYKCCNKYFRIAKYDVGGEFKLHKDGINQDSNGNRSYLTLNIFLNDNFEGGETDFYYDNKEFRYSVKPKKGTAALFYSQQYHCGNKVISGNKYLLRTDVMI
jgi:prolyl 4-hydroxylase